MLKHLTSSIIKISKLIFAAMPVSIITKDLVKRYRQRTVVNRVSIEVNQGEIGSWLDQARPGQRFLK
jgi:hypothetical protein